MLIPTSDHFIHPIRCIQSVWTIGILSQGSMGAPLYHYTGQVGPRFWNSRQGLWSESDIITSQLMPIPTSDLFIHPCKTYIMCFKHWYAISRAYGSPLYCYTGQVGPRFDMSGSLEEWKWHNNNITIKVNTHLRPLHTSILDIYNVF